MQQELKSLKQKMSEMEEKVATKAQQEEILRNDA